MNLTGIHEVTGLIPGLAQWVKDLMGCVAMGCGAGRRCSSDPVLLWLWCRPETTALIRPLAWEPPCAMGAAQENGKKAKKKKKTQDDPPRAQAPRDGPTPRGAGFSLHKPFSQWGGGKSRAEC